MTDLFPGVVFSVVEGGTWLSPAASGSFIDGTVLSRLGGDEEILNDHNTDF